MPFIQNLSNAIILACTYALMAVGLTMVYGVLKILHIAHAAVYTIGAFAGLLVFTRIETSTSSGLGFWIALPAAMLISGVIGVLIYRGIYHYMLDAPRTVPLIASIGLFVMLQDLLQKDFLMGPYQNALPVGGAGMPRIETAWFSLTPKQVLIFVVAAVLLAGVYLLLTRTRVGLGWRAAAMDRKMAAAVGVDLNRVVALNFFIGSALAGAAGVLVGLYNNSVFAMMGDVPSYKAFVIIVLGGMGSLPGVIVASLLLALSENLLVATAGYVLPRDAIAFLVLILVLMFRPHGLLGREE
ncbi:MAG: High-affinity branched-chain amino acid transport system permease protein LivH [Anaerolineales bacterium]|nr:High-affinity branched-chain amino acid transport system permease protein LivH [Anaerolineales bacterium]